MTENAPAITLDASALSELNELSQNADTGVEKRQTTPRLRINQSDIDCKHGLGSWIIGLKKDEADNIIDHGHKVVELIVLAVRLGYNLYHEDEANREKDCQSPFFKSFGDAVYGITHGHKCDKHCPYRQPGIKDKCGCQRIIYALAITETGERIPCIFYAKNSSYKPFDEFLKDRSNYIIQTANGAQEVSEFMMSIKLGSTRKKNKSVNYFEPVLSKGAFQAGENGDMAPIRELYNLHVKANDALEQKSPAGKKEKDVTAPGVAPKAATPAAAIPPAAPTANQQMGELPAGYGGNTIIETEPVASQPADLDLESAILGACQD